MIPAVGNRCSSLHCHSGVRPAPGFVAVIGNVPLTLR